MSPILSLQRRMMELGRVRLGEKGPRGEPRRRDTFRFTTASQTLAEAVAAKYGGTAEPWPDAPDGDGYWQVASDATALPIVLPPVFSDEDGAPTTTYSQWFETWSGGGCQRRCDGVTEMLSGQPCLCRPDVEDKGEDARTCQVTTRISFMLPDLPGLGVWRLDSKGWNAATELPGTLELLVHAASARTFIDAVLRIEQRVKKTPGEATRRFVVPVIDLPTMTLAQLASGEAPLALNAPRQSPPKPLLPSTAALPAAADLGVADDQDAIPFGEPPAIEPQSIRADSLGEELLAAHAMLGSDMDEVRAMVDQHYRDLDPADFDAWLLRQVERARENLAIRQAEELAQS